MSWLSCSVYLSGWLVQSDLSWLSCPSCLVRDILSEMSSPDLSVMSRLSCYHCPAPGHLVQCSPDATIMSWQSCHFCPFQAHLSRLTCQDCPVRTFLSRLVRMKWDCRLSTVGKHVVSHHNNSGHRRDRELGFVFVWKALVWRITLTLKKCENL